MKKTEKLSRWLLILIVFEVLLLLYCLFFAREILIEEGLFFVLGLFSAIVLSDLLLTWTILLSFALGIVFLVAGVVYIPNRIASYGGETNDTIQALLIHWSHEELFFQLQPREYNRTLNQINYLVTHHLKPNESLYYVSDGNFLILSSDSERDLKGDYMTVLKPQLEGLVFQGEDGVQAIQFQSGFLVVDQSNRTKYHRYKEMIRYLKRQLETDIIVEY